MFSFKMSRCVYYTAPHPFPTIYVCCRFCTRSCDSDIFVVPDPPHRLEWQLCDDNPRHSLCFCIACKLTVLSHQRCAQGLSSCSGANFLALVGSPRFFVLSLLLLLSLPPQQFIQGRRLVQPCARTGSAGADQHRGSSWRS